MRKHLAELESFAFCPLFYKQAGFLPVTLPDPISTLKTLIIYLYGRQLEVNYKVSWEEALNTWGRLWWKTRDWKDRQARREHNSGLMCLQQAYQYYREDERQPVAVNFPYTLKLEEHVILGKVPLILSNPEDAGRLVLVDVNQQISVLEMTRSLRLRAAALMVQQALGLHPEVIEVLCFNRELNLSHVRLYPTAEFQEASLGMLNSIIAGISQGHYYPNRAGCQQCQFNKACIA